MSFFDGRSSWIWHDGTPTATSQAGDYAVFARHFTVADAEAVRLECAVSADAEYRLFCNGACVGSGPVRGDGALCYYDVYDLAPYLRSGANELRAEVVSFAGYFPDFDRGGAPMSRMCVTGAFLLDATVSGADGREEFIGTDGKWLAEASAERRFFSVPGVPCAGPGEEFRPAPKREPAHAAKVLERAWTAPDVWNSLLPYRLEARQIPALRRTMQSFTGVFDCRGVDDGCVAAMRDGGYVEIPAHGSCEFTLDFGEETTARCRIQAEGNGTIELYYAEQLQWQGRRHFQPEAPHEPVAGPMRDIVAVAAIPANWQSFFIRAFRFVAVRITAGAGGMKLLAGRAERSVYPYGNTGSFVCDDPQLNTMWEVSRRTLELCSHDLFEDCPYYEQLQYAADARIGARSACAASGDTALARQAIEHFRRSLTPEGLTAGSYPTRSKVLLPLWSLHYIGMVYDYYLYSGDAGTARHHRNVMRQVLEWFAAHQEASGVVGRLPYWCVADFSGGWPWQGEPPGVKKEASALPNLMYADALHQYFLMTGEPWAEAEYQALKQAVLQVFYDAGRKLFADTAAGETFSTLTNATALLAGIVDDGEALADALANPAVHKAALFGNFQVFEALQQSSQFAAAEALLGEWEKLLIPGRSVWPEGTPVPRSECHVWSALPLSGLPRLYGGVTILEPGGKRIKLTPYQGRCRRLKTAIPLQPGIVHLDLAPARRRVKLPPGVEAVLADGRVLHGDAWQNF